MQTPNDPVAVAAYYDALQADLDEESACKAALIALEREYRERAQPWINQLCEIEARKPPRVFVPIDGPFLQAIKRGDF